jgi:hypothetical protein
MKATSCFGISLLIAFGAISFIPVARAQQTFQVIGCSSGKTVTLSEDRVAPGIFFLALANGKALRGN